MSFRITRIFQLRQDAERVGHIDPLRPLVGVRAVGPYIDCRDIRGPDVVEGQGIEAFEGREVFFGQSLEEPSSSSILR